MTPYHIFLLIFGTIGLTLIINRSYIFNPIRLYADKKNRHIGKLLKCSQCMGVWSTLINYLFIYLGLDIIVFAFAGSFFCYLTYLLMKPLFDKHDPDL
jgi:hypothetical protein